MTPEQITVEGFLSFKKRQTIDLSMLMDNDVPVCLINGSINNDPSLSNGAGKSSFTEILPVNFFGKIGGRAANIDEYINHDMDFMYTEVIFKMDGIRYKSVRTRNRNASGSYELTYDTHGGSIEDAEWQTTDRTIEDILGLSFVTYNSTVHLNEKDTMRFITGTAGERKEIVRELMDIVIFETASKKMSEEARKIETQIEMNTALINTKKTDITEESDIKSNIVSLGNEVDSLHETIVSNKADLKASKAKYENIKVKIDAQNKLEYMIKTESENVEEHEEEKKNKERKIEQLKDNIERKKEELECDKEKIKELLNEKKEIKKTITATEEEIQNIGNIDEDLKVVKESLSKKNVKLKSEEKNNTNISAEKTQITKWLEKIEHFGSLCPVIEEKCSVITPEFKEKSIKEKKETLENLEASEIQSSEKIAKLSEDIEDLEEEQQKLIDKFEVKNKLTLKLANKQSRLREIIGYSDNNEIKEKQYLNDVEKIEDEIKQLENEIAKLKNKIKTKNAEIEKMQGEIDENIIKKSEEINKKINSLDDNIRELEGKKSKKESDLAVLESKLERIKEVKAQIEKLLSKNEELLKQKRIYDTLTSVFGTEKIQKYLMKNAIPLLENAACELLKIFNNDSEKIKIKFDLDPKTAEGELKKKGGLDILVIEEGREPKDLRMYSGGETVKLVFSIILSLAKLLSKRSGKKHETLIIDEKIAKLDKRGIEQFAEIIRLISDWYKKIFIITHIESLKDIFSYDNEIVVNKTDEEGSVVSIHL